MNILSDYGFPLPMYYSGKQYKRSYTPKKFDRQNYAASTQRDVSNVTLKETFTATYDFSGSQPYLTFGFNPLLSFCKTDQLQTYLSLHDQLRVEQFNVRMTPLITNNAQTY